MYIDLRSDTVTQPTEEMRKAMFAAEVGDDVYGDDPTINKLESLAAQMLGKESAMFVPSGTMGNQLAIMTHTRRGQEIIISKQSHVFEHEVGSYAVLSGVATNQVEFAGGMFEPEKIKAAIRGDNIHYPDTGLICMENALGNGGVVPIRVMEEVYSIAKERNVPVHTDGARIFNAALALGVDVKEITKNTDSVMCCLSKGLCAPVGSILAGSEEFIKRARKNRKLLGGGLRQAGFLAAAGIIALEVMTKRLYIDHDNAKYLGKLLSEMPEVTIDLSSIQISMVFFKLDISQEKKDTLTEKMLAKGIKVLDEEMGFYRFVTSNDVTKENVDTVVEALKECIK